MTFSEAHDQFNAVINLLQTTGQLPGSYRKVITALQVKLQTLSTLERNHIAPDAFSQVLA